MNRREFLKGLGVTVAGIAITPSVLSGYTHDTVFVLDVSGSMPVEQIQKIILEASNHNGLLITFDMDIMDVIPLNKLTASTKLRGGAGTYFKAVDDYFADHALNPRKTVVFTDGMIFDGWGQNMPQNTEFVFVTASSKYSVTPPYGKVTFMESLDV